MDDHCHQLAHHAFHPLPRHQLNGPSGSRWPKALSTEQMHWQLRRLGSAGIGTGTMDGLCCTGNNIVQGVYKKKRQRGSPSHCGPLVEASTRQLRRTRESLLSRRNEPRTTGAHNGPRISSEHLQRLVSLLASWACGSVDVRRFKVWRARGDGRLGPGTSRVCACARARVQPSGRAGVRVHPRACARACGHDWMGARVPPKAP